MLHGRVAWFNERKGFGYIVTISGELVFVHYSAIKSREKVKNLRRGDKVEFDAELDEHGEKRAKIVHTRRSAG